MGVYNSSCVRTSSPWVHVGCGSSNGISWLVTSEVCSLQCCLLSTLSVCCALCPFCGGRYLSYLSYLPYLPYLSYLPYLPYLPYST